MTLLTKPLNEKVDQRTVFDAPGRVRLTFKSENAWAHWVIRLGESEHAPDAAVREPVNGEWVWRWMSSDAGIVCERFEVSHTTDNFRSHP